MLPFSHPAGRTPLHYAAMHGRVDAISVLVQHGASVRAADTRGHFQPLHLAADAGQCDAIARLLQLGADIEARTLKGFSPLVLAVMKVSLTQARIGNTAVGRGRQDQVPGPRCLQQHKHKLLAVGRAARLNIWRAIAGPGKCGCHLHAGGAQGECVDGDRGQQPGDAASHRRALRAGRHC